MELRKENPEKYYTFREEIGRGKYAVVKSCSDKKTRKQLVAKLIKYDQETEKNTKQEFDIMKTFKHDKLLTVKDGFIVQKYVVILMDRVEGEEVLEFLGDKSKATEEDASLVIAQLVEALCYLHRQNVVHLDIRPANLFVSKDFKLTLIDYGNARQLQYPDGQLVDAVGVTEFTAPEVLNFEMTHWGADMWSVGVLLYIFLSATVPFTVEDTGSDEDIDEKVAAKVRTAAFEMPSTLFRNATQEAENLIKKLLVRQPERRPTAEACLDDPWLSPILTQKRKASEIPAPKFKALNEQLKQAEEDELVVASCVLRSFDEDAYDSPDEEDE
ncbi:death-associated protein kinase 2-like [Orbicella faveolata]|uniref:death-associated protein kinase 2-like n=1 Tax=Orbicella faveolata TaxID=48498 RepID=UPI0009E1DB38|nr:death-associated protein kinase 2-like [Orbicella faveolata]